MLNLLLKGEFTIKYDTQIFGLVGRLDRGLSDSDVRSVCGVWRAFGEVNQNILARFEPCSMLFSGVDMAYISCWYDFIELDEGFLVVFHPSILMEISLDVEMEVGTNER